MEEGRELFLHLLFSVAFSSKESLCPAGLFVLCLYSRGMSLEPRNAGGLRKLENAHSFPLSLLKACIQLFHFSPVSPMSDFWPTVAITNLCCSRPPSLQWHFTAAIENQCRSLKTWFCAQCCREEASSDSMLELFVWLDSHCFCYYSHT